MNGLITFVIPSINRPSLLRCLLSLERQTNPNWRCIVIYDGVQGPVFGHEKVTFITIDKIGLIGPANGQAGLVRNVGIKACSTEWIGFLDDDDTIHPQYVETLFSKYASFDFVVWRMKYQNGAILPPLHSNELRFANVGISFCYKRSLGAFLFDKNRDGEDFDFLQKLFNTSKHYAVTSEVYYNVRH
jgi:glycosyltransferase involved in cell wall biosynthesis